MMPQCHGETGKYGEDEGALKHGRLHLVRSLTRAALFQNSEPTFTIAHALFPRSRLLFSAIDSRIYNSELSAPVG